MRNKVTSPVQVAQVAKHHC